MSTFRQQYITVTARAVERQGDSYIESNGLNIYGKKLIKIPTPQYYVLYNGTDEEEAVKELAK